MRLIKQIFVLNVVWILLLSGAAPACTSVMAGKKATADGSVLLSYTCDGWYDHRLRVVPGGVHENGERVPIYRNICTQTRPGSALQKVGEIPQAERTHAYFHVGYPFMNEKSVVMGEYTWGGREENTCQNALFVIEQLQILGLQRGATAREAIRVMGELAEKYGYADWGEALLVADRDEVWLFEIAGPGPLWTPESGRPGAVWAAVRCPDDSYAMGANRSRIGEIDFADTDNTLYSSNVQSFAAEMGWWKEGEPFVFHRAYDPEPYGSPYYQQRREWRVYGLLSPSIKLDENSADPYPLFQKPDAPITVQDLMALNRDVFEGTRFDMTQGPAAGPFGTPTRYEVTKEIRPQGRKENDWNRSISLFRCSYSFVSQVRGGLPDSLAAVVWFGLDQPITTCSMPIYAGTKKIPESYSSGGRITFDPQSTWWAFNFVSNWADRNFTAMIGDIRAERKRLEDRFFAEQADFERRAAELCGKDPEKAADLITEHVGGYMEEVHRDWWALAWTLVGKYNDGYRITSDTLEPLGYPTDWLEAVGFGDQDGEPKR